MVYMNSNDNVDVKNGVLHIKPVLTNEKYGQDFVRDGNLVLER